MSKCIWCGQEITKLNPDPRKAEYEKKWNIHWDCKDKIEDILDRSTAGVNRKPANEHPQQGQA